MTNSHVQTAQSILATHHLFHRNTALAPSPQFPGLEIVATAVVNITHLSIIASGLIVAGTAYLLTGLAIFFLVAHLTRNPRIAAVAAVVYATSPHFQFFDSYFIYETMALPFFILVILAVARMLDEKGPVANAWGLVAIGCAATTAVSHHVTGFALVLLLLGFSVIQYFLPREVCSRRLPIVFLVVTAIVVSWDLLVATSTWPYFKPVLEALIGEKPYKPPHPLGFTSIFSTKLTAGPTGAARPSDLALEYLSVLIFIVLAPIGAWTVWKRRREGMHAVTLGLAVGSLGIFAVVVIRVAAANGTVLAARSLTFVLIPVSFVMALLLCDRNLGASSTNKSGPPGVANVDSGNQVDSHRDLRRRRHRRGIPKLLLSLTRGPFCLPHSNARWTITISRPHLGSPPRFRRTTGSPPTSSPVRCWAPLATNTIGRTSPASF